VVPVVDRTFALSEAEDAVRYLEKGHPRGKVVVTTSMAGASGAPSPKLCDHQLGGCRPP
jgi:hypothetical protein